MTNDDDNNDCDIAVEEIDSRLLAEQEEYFKSQPTSDLVQNPQFKVGGRKWS